MNVLYQRECSVFGYTAGFPFTGSDLFNPHMDK